TVAVATSPPTDPRLRALLAAHGADAGSPPSNTRGPLYRLSLRRALAGGADRVHYLDFDRALHWIGRRPRELAAFVRRAPRRAALRLLARSRARDSGMYGEWVGLLVGLGEPLVYVECDGLDFETPDRHRAEIRRVGLAAWRRALSTPAEWAMRGAMSAEFERG